MRCQCLVTRERWTMRLFQILFFFSAVCVFRHFLTSSSSTAPPFPLFTTFLLSFSVFGSSSFFPSLFHHFYYCSFFFLSFSYFAALPEFNRLSFPFRSILRLSFFFFFCCVVFCIFCLPLSVCLPSQKRLIASDIELATSLFFFFVFPPSSSKGSYKKKKERGKRRIRK